MNYEIILRDKTQIRITENDYNNISKFLGQLKLFKLEDGQIVNAVDISRISPMAEQQRISKEFRLSEPDYGPEKSIRVPGGWQKLSIRDRMVKLFAKMKGQGCFKNFKSFQDWELFTYKQDIGEAE